MNISLTMYVPSRTPIERFYDPEFLANVTNLYYRQYTTIVAKQSLMSSDATTNATAPLAVMGSYITMRNRLVVRVWSTQWMVGLLIICLLLSLSLIFILPRHSVVPRNPSTLHGMAALVSNSRYLLEDLQDAGSGKEKFLKKCLKASTFSSGAFVAPRAAPRIPAQFIIERMTGDDSKDSTEPRLPQTNAKNIIPTMLRRSTRLMVAFTAIGLIIALELVLFISRSKGCLGYVMEDTYIYYVWTVVPALIFAALSMVFAIFDFAIRSVMPYTHLKRMVSVEEFMNLEFLAHRHVPAAASSVLSTACCHHKPARCHSLHNILSLAFPGSSSSCHHTCLTTSCQFILSHCQSQRFILRSCVICPAGIL